MKGFAQILAVAVLTWAGMAHAQDLIPANLRITTDPVATISLNHQQCIRSDMYSKSYPNGGEVLIKVSEPGYRTEYRTVSLRQGDRRHEAFELEPEPIPVLFRCNEEASVFCNGAELGVTPFYTFFKDPRAYRVIFRAEGCQDAIVNLDLSNGRPRVVDRELLSDSGTIQVTTTPAGAQIFVNGIERGVTPCTLSRIRAGRHTIALHADGYKPLRHELIIEAGETAPLNLTMERLRAGLTITTIPDKARVYVNDTYRGESNLTLSDIPEGRHSVRVEVPGYATETRTVQLKAGGSHVEEFKLIIVRGSLQIKTAPAEVDVYDGKKLIGKTSPEKSGDFHSTILRLTLTPGEHQLTFKADGYADLTKKVTIKANATEKLAVQLTFKPNFEVVTKMGLYRGVFVRRDEEGNCTVELKPGYFRVFLPSEIVSQKFLLD